jgi:hypothetical protein
MREEGRIDRSSHRWSHKWRDAVDADCWLIWFLRLASRALQAGGRRAGGRRRGGGGLVSCRARACVRRAGGGGGAAAVWCRAAPVCACVRRRAGGRRRGGGGLVPYRARACVRCCSLWEFLPRAKRVRAAADAQGLRDREAAGRVGVFWVVICCLAGPLGKPYLLPCWAGYIRPFTLSSINS